MAAGSAAVARRAARSPRCSTAARDGIVLRGKAEPGDKTMIDAWTPAVDAADAAATNGSDAAAVLAAASDAARAGAEATEPLVARKGRASYLGERSAGHRDPAPSRRRCSCRPRPMRRPRPRGREVATPGKVGIVFVSHSARIAEGLVDLARQMAPSAALVAAGGTDDGRIGTSFDLVSAGIGEADAGEGVAVLCDLGSAILTAETALDFLDDDVRARVRIVDAPLVEGGVAAAVSAEAGDDLEQVVAAAESARGGAPGATGPDSGAGASGAGERAAAASAHSRSVTLVNADGLHARPAAELVKLASTFPQKVTVNGTDAKSLLAIMSLGLTKGATVEIASEDPEGRAAVDAIAALAESGFGEA